MKSRLNHKPGQKETKPLVERYGAALLYVRYRYDPERGVRLKTVEIVVEEKPWRPRARFSEEDMVIVTVAYWEQDLRARLIPRQARIDIPGALHHIHVRARSLLCYWAVHELGMTATALAKTLGLSQPAVTQCVRRGEKVATDNGWHLPGLLGE